MSSASKGCFGLLLMVSALAVFAVEPTSHQRVLAASCAACHGTNGNSVGITPVLAGLDKTHFITQMQAFRNGGRPATVMHQHSKGLTEREIEQLADYFSIQPRKAASVPMPLNF
jgi:cytochrome c553